MAQAKVVQDGLSIHPYSGSCSRTDHPEKQSKRVTRAIGRTGEVVRLDGFLRFNNRVREWSKLTDTVEVTGVASTTIATLLSLSIYEIEKIGSESYRPPPCGRGRTIPPKEHCPYFFQHCSYTFMEDAGGVVNFDHLAERSLV